jgi:hypothetical protein
MDYLHVCKENFWHKAEDTSFCQDMGVVEGIFCQKACMLSDIISGSTYSLWQDTNQHYNIGDSERWRK